MECSRIQDRLVAYLTEETRITEQLCVQVHLATCYHCREALNDTRAVLVSAKQAIRYPGPERSFESAMNEFRTREALLAFRYTDGERTRSRLSWGMAAAALPIVVACVTPFVVAWPGSPFTHSADEPGPARIESLHHSETVALENGLVPVRLDGGRVTPLP